MQGTLSSLLGRNFVVAAFFPAFVFVIFTILLTGVLGIPLLGIIIDLRSGQLETLTDTIAVVLISWLLGLLLTIFNIQITQVLEGYGKWNPLQVFKGAEHRRYYKLQCELNELEEIYHKEYQDKEQAPVLWQQQWNDLSQKMVTRFPRKKYLLPTALGNTIRAFEDYPRVMYGFDPIPGWLYIYNILPDRISKKVDETRAYLDFWVHTCALSFVYVFMASVLVVVYNHTFWWVPFVALLVMRGAYSGAVSTAELWGKMVKSAVDLFLPDLRKHLGFATPATRYKEQELWRHFSEAVIYHDPEILPERSHTAAEEPEAKN
jgi:hypothetical protein